MSLGKTGFNRFLEKKEKLILTTILILYFSYFMFTSLADYRIFGNWHDLCRNTQIYYTLMKGEFFTSRLHSDTNQKAISIFCDHFKPSMVFFTPFFLLVPKPETLIFIRTLFKFPTYIRVLISGLLDLEIFFHNLLIVYDIFISFAIPVIAFIYLNNSTIKQLFNSKQN